MQPSPDAITDALSRVIDPELRKPVTELDMVREVDVRGTHAEVTIALTVPGCPLRHSFEEQVQRELMPLEGIESWAADREVYAYFNNDWNGYAVRNGLWLRRRLGV